ncbi:MAG: hypothetical protein IKT82_04795 [Bacteroidaceae bacterium]|jgi:hypothetical protein|nr:hypothetical protein [Bacteroidaceae bacterium]
MKYTDQEIRNSVLDCLGYWGERYFKAVKREHGSCWYRYEEDGWDKINWTTEGVYICDYLKKVYPDIIDEFGGDEEEFTDYVNSTVEEMFK